MDRKSVLHQHRLLTALTRKYPDRYVAMAGGKILAMGKDQFKVLREAEKKPWKGVRPIGLYYLPGKKQTLYLLINRAHSL